MPARYNGPPTQMRRGESLPHTSAAGNLTQFEGTSCGLIPDVVSSCTYI